MTTEEKAKAYDEALKRVSPLYEQAIKDGNPIWSTYEYLIPELRESEDERIGKTIYDEIKNWDASYRMFETYSKESVLAYLEKQKEYPTNEEMLRTLRAEYEKGVADTIAKYEQKEQSITANDLDEEIKRFFDDCIDVHEAKLYGNISERVIPVDCYELTARHFAKWGEKYKEQKEIFDKCVENCDPKVMKEVSDKVDEMLGKEQKPAESISQLTVQSKGVYKICPRCKERMVRDDSKVYTSMPPQYGYKCLKCGEMEFDTVMYDSPVDDKQKGQNLIMANSPQLKEQKPTDLPPGFYFIDLDGNRYYSKEFRYGDMKMKVVEQKPAEWNANDKAFIKDCARILDENGYEASAERLLSMFPVKPAEWSEEDKKMRDRIIDILNRTFSVYSAIGTSSTRPSCPTYKDEIEWLKSLRPQPQGVYKQIVNSIYKMLKGKDFYGMPISNCISLLNDIRVKCKDADECAEILDEPYWKPSDEQMEALRECGECKRCIKELYEQLKKLM